MDSAKRIQLIETIRALGLPDADGPAPVVSLEAFFDGNGDLGSIGCNLMEHPGIERFFGVLRAIRDRPDVNDVLIEIFEVEEDDLTMWPFSERVVIISSLDLQAVCKLLTDLKPSEVDTGISLPPSAPEVPNGFSVYSAWWD